MRPLLVPSTQLEERCAVSDLGESLLLPPLPSSGYANHIIMCELDGHTTLLDTIARRLHRVMTLQHHVLGQRLGAVPSASYQELHV